MKKDIGYANGIVKIVVIDREYTRGKSLFSKGYRDYFEITFNGETTIYRRYFGEDISTNVIKKLQNKTVYIRYFESKKFKIINMLAVNGVKIIDSEGVGLFPFLLFFCLGICSIVWSIWGFYITYLASDEKRKEILGE